MQILKYFVCEFPWMSTDSLTDFFPVKLVVLEEVLNKSMLKMLRGICIWDAISRWYTLILLIFPPNWLKTTFSKLSTSLTVGLDSKFPHTLIFTFLLSNIIMLTTKKSIIILVSPLHTDQIWRVNFPGYLKLTPHYQMSNLSLRKHKAACLNQLN